MDLWHSNDMKVILRKLTKDHSQSAFIFSMLTTETLVQGMN